MSVVWPVMFRATWPGASRARGADRHGALVPLGPGPVAPAVGFSGDCAHRRTRRPSSASSRTRRRGASSRLGTLQAKHAPPSSGSRPRWVRETCLPSRSARDSGSVLAARASVRLRVLEPTYRRLMLRTAPLCLAIGCAAGPTSPAQSAHEPAPTASSTARSEREEPPPPHVVTDERAPGVAPGDAVDAAPPAMIRGRVSDFRGAPLPGVTVVVTGPALQGTRSLITDDEGRFEMFDVPTGAYTVTFYYGDATIRRAGVQVTPDRGAIVYARFEEGAAGDIILLENAGETSTRSEAILLRSCG